MLNNFTMAANKRNSKDAFLTGSELEKLYKACSSIDEKLLVCTAGQLGIWLSQSRF